MGSVERDGMVLVEVGDMVEMCVILTCSKLNIFFSIEYGWLLDVKGYYACWLPAWEHFALEFLPRCVSVST